MDSFLSGDFDGAFKALARAARLRRAGDTSSALTPILPEQYEAFAADLEAKGEYEMVLQARERADALRAIAEKDEQVARN